MIKINRKLKISELIDKLGYKKYINEDFLKTIKNEGPKEVEVEFFNLEKSATNTKVLQEYEKRGLIPDFGAVITYLIENPETLDEKDWIGVQMEDNVYAAFDHWDGGPRVSVLRDDNFWVDSWWFGGRRKSFKIGNSELIDPKSFELPKILTINGVKYVKQRN